MNVRSPQTAGFPCGDRLEARDVGRVLLQAASTGAQLRAELRRARPRHAGRAAPPVGGRDGALMPLVSERYLDARRDDILNAAKGVFVRKGFAEATMQDIATDAGVSAGSIYRYFASKE